MRKLTLAALAATIITAACSTKHERPAGEKPTEAISIYHSLPGDSAIYGLACDGCTDSILIFLPYTGGDPDTFDIINARQQHHIMGRPHIGDPLSVTVNPDNRAEALSVINIGLLEGQWCYMATPTLRTIEGKTPPLPDSIKRKILVPVEYSMRLKADHTATVMGHMRNGKAGSGPSPAVYPDIQRYTEWHPFNGRLILRADTIAGFTKAGEVPQTDTAEIVLLMRDSLILRIGDKQQPFYRKRAE